MNFPNSILLTSILALTFSTETSADERYTRDARFAEHPGKLVAWGEASSPNNPVDLVETLPRGRAAEGFIQVTGGDSFWAALHEDGTIYTYRCPKPDMRMVEGKIVKISAGFDQLVALDDQGHGYLWTQGHAKNFSPSADLVDLVDIEASNAQGYAVTADGRLIYWGRADPSNSTFSEKIAPHQGNIASLACVGFGGAAMSLDGAILRWGIHGKNPQIEFDKELPLSDYRRFVAFEHRILYQKTDGTWEKIGGEGWPSGLKAERMQITSDALAYADLGDGRWSAHSDGKFPTMGELEKFLSETNLAAVQSLGHHRFSRAAEERTLGLVAIVPTGMDAMKRPDSPPTEPGSTTESMVAPTTPLAVELPTDHGISDARFLALLKVYETELKAKAEITFDQSLETLNTKLDDALEREEKKAIGAGNLDRVTTYRAERERLAADEIPETDSEKTGPTIKRFRSAWRAERAKIDAQRALDAAPVRESFEDKLSELETTLTKEEKIEEALKVRAFREHLVPGAPN